MPQESRSIPRLIAAAAVACVTLASPARAEDPNPASIHSTRGAWPLLRQWNLAEQRHFAAWIEHLYDKKTSGSIEQRVAKLERVLKDPEMNLLLDPDFAGAPCNPDWGLGTIRALHGVVDCAKLVVTLTSYYASRRGLPLMFAHVRAFDGSDVRTAEYTIPAGGSDSLTFPEDRDFFLDAATGVCTGNFRVEPNGPNAEASDTAPVAIDRNHLLPGCLFYLDGHVLILAKIDPYGEPRFLDATTAKSRDIYTHNGFNAVTGITPSTAAATRGEYAGCYRGFRVLRFPIAETNEEGKVIRVRRRTDAEMAEFGYSLEQYDKLRELIGEGKIIEQGVPLDSFHQFVRARLRTVKSLDLASEIQASAQDLLALVKTREERVQAAWRDVQENGPIAFPEDDPSENVFTTRGRWGALATAVTDAELRARYFDLASRIEAALPWFDLDLAFINLETMNKHAIWNHADYANAVLRAKNRAFTEATFQYANAAGQPVTLSLADVETRLFDLSFDPNHPPELRWGAPLDSAEARTAPETPTPVGRSSVPMAEAYRREAYYRSLTQREVDESFLTTMAPEGFPIREKLDPMVARSWLDLTSPPLVPHNGKLAWIKEQAAAR